MSSRGLAATMPRPPAPETVAFQGERGAYSEQAVRRCYGDEAQPIPCSTLAEAFATVAEGRAQRAVVPVENALEGTVNRTYDLLLEHELDLEAEVVVPIRHQLLALPGVSLDDVERVRSHPQALAQCRQTLEELGLAPTAARDTAGSARRVAEEGNRREAAIASRLAGRMYELETLAEDVQDEDWNQTRFLALAREPEPPEEGPYRTSLVLSTDHSPGALFEALEPLAERGINLTKLESRPTREQAWQYRFHLDLEGHRDDEPVAAALEELDERVPFLRVFSSYPIDEGLVSDKR